MAETYCGKTCENCQWKEQLNCTGCKTGPGRQFSGDCELAKCVRTKGHETCDTCGLRGHCGNLRGKDREPEFRHRRLQREQEERDLLARRIPILGKWLWILFWLIIPSSIGSLLGNDTISQLSPGLYLVGVVLNTATRLIFGLILLKLGSENFYYKVSGICCLIAGGLSLVSTLLTGNAENPIWEQLLMLPAAIVGIIAEYNEYTGHAEVLEKLDPDLSEKWTKLWVWYLSMTLCIVGCVVLLFIAPMLAALILLGSAIGVAVVSVIKLLYLYRTAKLFREYPIT